MTKNLLCLFLTCIFISQIFVISIGTGDIFQNDLRNHIFDALAESLSEGRSDVPRKVVAPEGFYIDGKSYSYFGPFPALLRIIPQLIFKENLVPFSRISCLMASLIFLISLSALLIFNLNLSKLSNRAKKLTFCFSMIGFAYASVWFYLLSCGYIYHEVILWALAWQTSSLYFIFKILNQQKVQLNLLLLSLTTACTLLTRVTFALPLMGFIFFILVKELFRNKKYKILITQTPLVLALFYYAQYNYSRFGSIFKFVDYKYYHSVYDYSQFEAVGAFNLKRLPTTFENYFLTLPKINLEPPFLHLKEAYNLSLDKFYHTGYFEWVLGLPIASSWLLLPILIGAYVIFTNRKPLPILLSGLFIIQIILILSFYFVTHRYTAEFYGLIILLFCFCIRSFTFSKLLNKRPKTSLISAILLLFVSLVINVSTAISWNTYQNWAVDKKDKERLLQVLENIDPSK